MAGSLVAKGHVRRRLLDRLGRGLVALGALVTLGAIALLAGFIIKEIVPLLIPATAAVEREIVLASGGSAGGGQASGATGAGAPGAIVATGVDEFREKVFLLREDGSFDLVDTGTGEVIERLILGESVQDVQRLDAHREGALGAGLVKITTARYEPERGRIALGFADGRAASVEVAFPVSFEGDRRIVSFWATGKEGVHLAPEGTALVAVDWVETRERTAVAGVDAGGGLHLTIVEASRSFFGGSERVVRRHDLTQGLAGRPTAIALAPDGNLLLVGDDAGLLYQWDLSGPQPPRLVAAMVAAGVGAGRVVDWNDGTDQGGGRSVSQALGEMGGAGTGRGDERRHGTGEAGIPVTVMRYLIGGRSLVVGDAAGGVTTWFAVPVEGRGRLMQPVHVHQPHEAPVTHVAASQRNRTFATADASGAIKLHHSTSERTLLALRVEHGRVMGGPADHSGAGRSEVDGGEAGAGGVRPIVDLVIAPKSDGMMTVSDSGITLWRVHNPHPEISLTTLFGRVHYEGYAGPEWVWQSTGGSDAFEPKLSLTPLVYGTLKGTFYALIVALPLGVLGAIYTSQFMSERLQQLVKPVVEVMAGLPSVVLGFLAGLWLAPLIASVFPALVLMAVFLPCSVILCAWLWRRLARARREAPENAPAGRAPMANAPIGMPDQRPVGVMARGVRRLTGRLPAKLPAGGEALVLVPVIALAAWAAFELGPWLEARVMQGDFRFWLFDVFGLSFDQRNSLVVGIAMGFAVIPIVFSVSEDALSSVPQDVIAGSLALGATRWQTVRGIVIPAALPGIVSAIMMGIGRAVGETMIVLMATGNTPVMDFNLFNGFRALSATIAVEMPEAPAGGTLYRVLFVAALLLFGFTFTLNTLGEWVRTRVQRQVQR